MFYAYVLAGLFSIAAAVPMKVTEESVYIPPMVNRMPVDMEKADAYNSYIPYAEYGPYGSYPRAVEEAAARLAITVEHAKRNVVRMAGDTTEYIECASYSPCKGRENYDAVSSGTVERGPPKQMVEQGLLMEDHGPVTNGLGPVAMDHEREMKHHELVMDAAPMAATDEQLNIDTMPISTETYDPMMAERSVDHPDPSEMASGPHNLASATLPNNWYGKYDPYQNYGEYDIDEAKGGMDA